MDGPQSLGLLAGVLGVGMNGARAAAKRYNWPVPGSIEVIAEIGSLALIAIALVLLLRTFLTFVGTPLPTNSPWPGTLLYCFISVALILAAGYLPERIPSKASVYKTDWEPPLAESFFLYQACFESGKLSNFKVKIIATKQGMTIARLLVQILRRYDWQLEINVDDGTYVFPAATIFRGARIRYRQSQEATVPDAFGVVSALAEIPQTQYFPEDDQFNFVQIEIGDVPEFYSGPPQFMNRG